MYDAGRDNGAEGDVTPDETADGGSSADADATRIDADADSADVGAPDAAMDATRPAVCGDGVVEGPEACDDQNTADGDYCAADCGALTGACGDSVLQSNESCDDGVTADCAATRDGGDGACVPAGTCAPGFFDDGTGCVAEQLTQHVHIFVENDCSMMVDPPELNVPRGQTVKFSWHNHSQFYAVDVWQSYIGGFTDLGPQMTWNEQFEWCFNVNPYVGYSDISSAPGCPEHRFFITCNGR